MAKLVILNKTNALLKETPFSFFYQGDRVVKTFDHILVNRVPPHFLTKAPYGLREMTRPEKLSRLKEIEDLGLDRKDPTLYYRALISVLFVVAASVGIYQWLT